MTKAEMERRLLEVEAAVQRLVTQRSAAPDPTRPWWRDDAGRFANDPEFDEIVRFGREYRESLRPGGKVKRANRDRA
jgi:hypothetical protein